MSVITPEGADSWTTYERRRRAQWAASELTGIATLVGPCLEAVTITEAADAFTAAAQHPTCVATWAAAIGRIAELAHGDRLRARALHPRTIHLTRARAAIGRLLTRLTPTETTP